MFLIDPGRFYLRTKSNIESTKAERNISVDIENIRYYGDKAFGILNDYCATISNVNSSRIIKYTEELSIDSRCDHLSQKLNGEINIKDVSLLVSATESNINQFVLELYNHDVENILLVHSALAQIVSRGLTSSTVLNIDKNVCSIMSVLENTTQTYALSQNSRFGYQSLFQKFQNHLYDRHNILFEDNLKDTISDYCFKKYCYIDYNQDNNERQVDTFNDFVYTDLILPDHNVLCLDEVRHTVFNMLFEDQEDNLLSTIHNNLKRFDIDERSILQSRILCTGGITNITGFLEALNAKKNEYFIRSNIELETNSNESALIGLEILNNLGFDGVQDFWISKKNIEEQGIVRLLQRKLWAVKIHELNKI